MSWRVWCASKTHIYHISENFKIILINLGIWYIWKDYVNCHFKMYCYESYDSIVNTTWYLIVFSELIMGNISKCLALKILNYLKNNFVSNRFFLGKYTSLQVIYFNVNNTTEKRMTKRGFIWRPIHDSGPATAWQWATKF